MIPRLLLEYQQLLKNMNYTPEQRLFVYEKYPDLLAERDDCYLDKLTLLSQIGDFEKAIKMAKIKRFHIMRAARASLQSSTPGCMFSMGIGLSAKEIKKKLKKFIWMA